MNPLVIIGIAAVAYYAFMGKSGSKSSSNTQNKRQQLANWITSGGDSQATKQRVSNLFLTTMSDAENFGSI